MDAIIWRYDADEDYRFIDTKLDLMTGKDFSVTAPWFKQKNIIFCWIQGRAMEALAGISGITEKKKTTSAYRNLNEFLPKSQPIWKDTAGKIMEGFTS